MGLNASRLAMWREGEEYWNAVCLLLPKDQATLIDADLFEWAVGFKWQVMGRSIFYVEYIPVRYIRRRCGAFKHGYFKKPAETYMNLLPREIVKRVKYGVGDGQWCEELRDREVDHIDTNPWNNRDRNLRVATHLQNMMNKGKAKNSKCRYKGVYELKKSKKWAAKKTIAGKHYHIGTFDEEIEAAIAYNNFVKKRCGEFGYLNPITTDYAEENHKALTS